MGKINKMTAMDLAELVVDSEFDDIISFALEDHREEKTFPCIGDDEMFEEWYYIQKRGLPYFDSYYAVIDWCGGGEAFAVALNNDGDDVCLIETALYERFGKRDFYVDENKQNGLLI